ncbi:MAG: hypothetical protein ACU0B1_16475, partial [Thermohalobaculum sp.]
MNPALPVHFPGDGAPRLAYIDPMARLISILLLIIGAFAMIKISSWRTGRTLRRRSRPLMNDQIEALLSRLARTAGIES